MTEMFIVHMPQDWRKLMRLIEEGQRKRGFIPSYRAKCSGRKVELPPKVRIREDENGPYFSAGPHESYYEMCDRCKA